MPVFNTPETPSNGHTDSVLTKDLVDRVVAAKLQNLDAAEARKAASEAAAKQEAADIMSAMALSSEVGAHPGARAEH